MAEILQVAGSLGVGAFLATLIFIMYRRDRCDTEARIHNIHESHSQRIEILLKHDQSTREENTKALTELITLLKRMNGRS